MTDPERQSKVGALVGFDISVGDAPALRDFYAAVVGWSPQPLDMGGYEDYFMNDPAGGTVAGICHARGDQADLPPQWLAYVAVADLAVATAKAEELGGAVVAGPKGEGPGSYCVIRDPAGAVIALIQDPGES